MQYWELITRFGEVQILLPAALLAALALLRRPQTRSIALLWISSLSTALLLTTASKVAFIGWGIGWPELNFTGISGHAMVATAVYPLLLGALASRAPLPGRRAAVGAGYAIALLVGVSRVALGAHSTSEVLAGLLVGGAASAARIITKEAGSARNLPLSAEVQSGPGEIPPAFARGLQQPPEIIPPPGGPSGPNTASGPAAFGLKE